MPLEEMKRTLWSKNEWHGMVEGADWHAAIIEVMGEKLDSGHTWEENFWYINFVYGRHDLER